MFFGWLADRVLRHRALATLVLLVLVLVPASGVVHLQVDFSADAFFGSGDPALEALKDYRDRWGRDDDALLVIVDGQGESLLDRPHLEAISAVVDAIEEDERVREVVALTELSRPERRGPVVVSVPIASSPPAPDVLLADRLLVPSMLSADGTLAVILVRLGVDTDNIATLRPAVLALDQHIQANANGLTLHLAGIPAARAGLMEALVTDQMLFVPLSAFVVLAICLALFRRLHGVLVPLLAATVPPAMTFGLMGWTGENLSIINQTFITLLPVIAIADSIHMVTRFHEELDRGVERIEAIRIAMRNVGAACLLTSVTTAVGFMSLMLADMTILRSFGLYAAAGIAFAWLSVVMVVPLCLSLTASMPHPTVDSRVDRLLTGTARLAVRRPWTVLAGTALFLVACLVSGSRVTVDNHLTGMLPSDHPTTAANHLIDSDLGGLLTLDIELEGPVRERHALEAMLRAEEALEAIVEVRSARSPASVAAQVTSWMGGGWVLPSTEGALNSILERDGMEAMLDDRGALMSVRVQDVGANAFARVAEQVDRTARDILEPAGLQVRLNGTPLVAYRGVNAVTTDLRDSLAGAFIVIAVLIGLLFRSPRVALLSLVPNAMPLVVGYGFFGLTGWPLDPAPAVVFTVALGIAVDDTIHLLVRFREEGDIVQAVRHSGRAVFVTSVMLAAGFGMNVLSAFPSNRSFGALGAVILVAALVCDVLVLPALLQVGYRPNASTSAAS